MAIQFDDGVADALAQALEAADDTLRGIGYIRSNAVTAAVTDFKGGYSRLFVTAAQTESQERGRLARLLDEVRGQVQDAKAAARKERDRQTAHDAWKQRDDARRQEEYAASVQGLPAPAGYPEPEPDSIPVASPHITASFSPSARTRHVANGGAKGTSSADPERLRHFVTTSQGLTRRMESALTAVHSATASFQGSCSWTSIAIAPMLDGFSRLIDENRRDETWMTAVADAFDSLRAFRINDFLITLAVVADNPEALQQLLLGGTLSVKQVASIWQLLTATPGFDADKILKKYAHVLGALDGMPALARVTANKYNAERIMKTIEAELAALKPGDKNASYLQKQIEYLTKVVNGEVQLYLYDPAASRIVEMLGTPGPDTIRAITYVPGTYTSLHSFHNGGVQHIAKYLTGKKGLPGSVAFVYKDGIFPGENEKTGNANMLRITEANDLEFGRSAGEQLERFQAGMRADPYLSGVKQMGVGHSWGLANLTSSEVAGARYDKVISLAGAWMLPDWEPAATTAYLDVSYEDVLTRAQREGYVGEGRYPRRDPAFTSLVYPGYGGDTPDLNELVANHNLIATTDDDNQDVIDTFKKALER